MDARTVNCDTICHMQYTRHLRPWLVLGLVFFSFAASIFFSSSVFEHLPHLEDELAYQFQARVLARGDLVIDSPQNAGAFWKPFVVDRGGHRFGKYPLGWPAQLAIGEILGAPWMVNAWLAALTTALMYSLGSAIFNRDTGLIAAALTASSPIALLLSGTLMGHTSALCFSVLLLYAAWRMERSKHAVRWGVVAGIALGMIIANRPMSGIALGLPLIVWKGGRFLALLAAEIRRSEVQPRFRQTRAMLWPLVVMSVITLLIAATIPLFSAVAVGDPTVNLYTQVWGYDRIGFGEGYGVSGHTLAKGFNHLGWDLSLLAADLFGWQRGSFTDAVITHLQQNSDRYPNLGLSWVLLPFGLWIALRRSWVFLVAWVIVGVGLVWLALNPGYNSFAEPSVAWLWIGCALAWALAPAGWSALRGDVRQHGWIWVLIGVGLCVLIGHMTYWVGSQRYSTRYYFEALIPLALLSAVPLAWAAKRFGRAPVYLAVGALCLFTFTTYSLPRIGALHGFNNVTQAWIDRAVERRQADCPLLVIVTGPDLSWRSMGTFMAVTSPYLDSDIIGAYNRVQNVGDSGLRNQLIAAFPERQVIEMQGQGIDADFVDTESPTMGCEAVPAS